MKAAQKIGHFIGGRLGGPTKGAGEVDPLASTIIGMAAMTVASRLLPARFALIGAAIATGYATRKLAQRAERRAAMGQGQESGGKAATAPRKKRRKPAIQKLPPRD